jgi:hypothetical protein
MSIVDILKESTPKYTLTIPSTGEDKTFRPFLVKEEKILLIAKESNNEISTMKAIKDLISRCVEDLENVEDLPMFDIEYIYLQLRAVSIGEKLNPVIICPETKEKIKVSINIEDIHVQRNKKHTNEIKITKDIIITMKYPSVKIMEEVNKHKSDDEKTVPLFYAIINTIDQIETKDETLSSDIISREELKEFVNNLTKQQYEKIIKFYATSPKIEHTVEYKTSDGETREITLRGLLDFFK